MYDTRECNLFILQTPANRKYSKGLIIRLLCCICVLVYLYISISVFVHWTLGNIIFVILEPPALQINTQCFKTHKSGTLQIKNFGPIHKMDNSEKTTFLVVFTKFYAPLLMCWPCWYTDKLILLMRWSCWCAILLIRLSCWCADALILLIYWCWWCTDAADVLMLLMHWCTNATESGSGLTRGPFYSNLL